MCAKLPPKIVGICEKALFSPLSFKQHLQKKGDCPFFSSSPAPPHPSLLSLLIPHSVKHCYFSAETSAGSTTILINLIPPSTSGDCHILRDWNSFATSRVSHDALDQWYPRQQAGRIVACVQADKGKTCLLLTLSAVGRSHRVHFPIALLVYNA